MFVHHHVAHYAVRLVQATRRPEAVGAGSLAPHLALGASPRATLGLVRASRALPRSEFNNYGPPVKVWALGEDVTGVYVSGVFHRGYPDHDNPDPAISIIRRPFAGYATWSGTSLASPRVTGLIAEAMTEHGITSPEEAARFVLTSPRAVPTENLPLPTGHDGQHVPLITHGIE